MKRSRIIALVLATATISTVFFGCAPKKETRKETIASNETFDPTAEEEKETIIFTDSAGREVEIPKNIQKVAPSGAVATMALYTINPDKLIGINSKFSKATQKYIPQKYQDLPEFGQFYGKKANINFEAIAAAKPDLIIDIGEAKETVKEDMDSIQEQLTVPVIFIEATLDTMPEAYEKLGQILGEEEQCKKLSEYIGTTLKDIDEKSASISEEEKTTIYYAEGENGLKTDPSGSIHADVFDRVGAKNVAQPNSGASGSEVSMEQIIGWNPEVIVCSPEGSYQQVYEDSTWGDIQAIKDKKVYESPEEPYNWLGRPPSINRVIGLKWMGNLLYPDIYDYDMIEEAKEFYKLFYHYELSDENAKELMKNSTFMQ